VLTVENISTIY